MDAEIDRPATDRFPHTENYVSCGATPLDSADSTEIRAAIERVYEAFAHDTLAKPLDACEHCFTDNDINYLETTPLRSFSSGDCYTIAHKLVSTLGTEKDFRYFLPRLIEHKAQGGMFVIFAGFLEKLIEAAKCWPSEDVRVVYYALQRIAANEAYYSDFETDEVGLLMLKLEEMAST